MPGRPTKLTPHVQKRICDAISAGNYREAAAQYGGVDKATLMRWLASDRQPYRDFRDAVIAAEAEAEVRMVAQWQAQIPEDWRAARDFLARRHPDRWGPLEKREVTGAGGKPIAIVEVPSDPDRAAEVLRVLAEVGVIPASDAD